MDTMVKRVELVADQFDDYGVVKQFMLNRLGDFKLSKEQVRLMENYQLIYAELCSRKFRDSEIAANLVKAKRVNSKTSALRLIEQCKDIYGRILNVNKAFELRVMLDTNRRLMEKAERLGEMQTVAMLEKNRLSILAEVEDVVEAVGEHFTGYKVEAVYDPRLLGIEPVDKLEVLNYVNERRGEKISTEWLKGMEDAEVVD